MTPRARMPTTVRLLLGLAAVALGGCGPPRVRITPAAGTPVISNYGKEFADAVQVATHNSQGTPLTAPHFYLPSSPAELSSPDGRWELRDQPMPSARHLHRLVLFDRRQSTETLVVVLQEKDPGSGKSHACRWSADSKALFVFGGVKPAGYELKQDWALVHLVDGPRLYECDLRELLAARLNQVRRAK